eukprot:TRINITY_DN4999_c0_g1_i2.p2 TRINITY_DN4999_c0_g1~~TRINITY_DN4999_c0_g1_i2.p2  ORF type:complete len:171 (+),score=15.80 TRINITY_DN4999_c0_g1_i2:108-620(+)
MPSLVGSEMCIRDSFISIAINKLLIERKSLETLNKQIENNFQFTCVQYAQFILNFFHTLETTLNQTIELYWASTENNQYLFNYSIAKKFPISGQQNLLSILDDNEYNNNNDCLPQYFTINAKLGVFQELNITILLSIYFYYFYFHCILLSNFFQFICSHKIGSYRHCQYI